jgi:hypothetical protein
MGVLCRKLNHQVGTFEMFILRKVLADRRCQTSLTFAPESYLSSREKMSLCNKPSAAEKNGRAGANFAHA